MKTAITAHEAAWQFGTKLVVNCTQTTCNKTTDKPASKRLAERNSHVRHERKNSRKYLHGRYFTGDLIFWFGGIEARDKVKIAQNKAQMNRHSALNMPCGTPFFNRFGSVKTPAAMNDASNVVTIINAFDI
jgi:hypothetical protein